MQLVSDQWYVFGMDFFSLRRLSIFKKENSKSLPVSRSEFTSLLIWIFRQKNIDYAVCKALNSKTMKGINRSLLVYDIFCQWTVNFLLRVDQSPFLSIPEGMEIIGAIGDFHVVGHIDDCLPRYTLAYVPGSGVIDGEILETLWAVLNETSRSAKGATMAHRNEILDDHMNHSNWMKLIGMSKYFLLITMPLKNIEHLFNLESSLLRKMKRATKLLKGSKESYEKLTESASPADLQAWQEGELTAQRNRGENVKSMDYYALKCIRGTVFIHFSFVVSATKIAFPGSAPGKAEMQLRLSQEQPSGKVAAIQFLSEGISVQESQ